MVADEARGSPGRCRARWRQLIALTRRAAVVIAGDLEAAAPGKAALERPVVGIFGPTDPARNGPYGTRSRVFRDANQRDQPQAGRSKTEARMQGIGADEVMAAAALELLGAGRG